MTCKKCGTAVEDGKKILSDLRESHGCTGSSCSGTRADPCSDPCTGTGADRSSRRQRNPQCSGKSV